jgi:hypothetical protein
VLKITIKDYPMILRRFSKHVTDQNWFAVGLDVLVVITGIFIGMQITEWNETRKSKEVTQSYYMRLLKDLRTEEALRSGRINYLDETIKHGEIVLDGLSIANGDRHPQFLHHLYQASQLWPYMPHRATYDEMLSGNIALIITDTELRTKLANYFVRINEQMYIQNERTAYRGKIRQHLLHPIQSYIRDNCNETAVNIINVVSVKVWLPLSTCELDLDRTVIDKAFKRLESYTNLETDLNRHLADMEQKRTGFNHSQSQTKKLIEALERKMN